MSPTGPNSTTHTTGAWPESQVARLERELEEARQELEATTEAWRKANAGWIEALEATTEAWRKANAGWIEARQERDSLRAAVDEWSETAGKRRTERNDARARIGEIEAALREITALPGDHESQLWEHGIKREAATHALLWDAVNIARRALQPTPTQESESHQ